MWPVSGEVSAGFGFEGVPGVFNEISAGSEKRLVGLEKSLDGCEILAGSEDILAGSELVYKSVEVGGEREQIELAETH